jgi:tRNA threonylcarbamoyladenosine biosynthesis protein TsaB
VILGFDTATADTIVAILDGEDANEAWVGPGPDGRPAHGRALLPEVERLVGEAGGWGAIKRIAVGIGPGSFTGLRIGVSTARALAQARDLPLAGIPTTTALVTALGALPEAAGRPRLALIDARRGELFAALDDGDGPGEPVVCAPGDLARILPVSGAESALAAGDGSLRFRSEIEAAGVEVLPDRSPVHRVSGGRICLLGAAAAATEPGEVRPMYLRRPDAERWRERDGRN